VVSKRTPNAIDKRLGEQVRARRLAVGMSQERLAELLGITFQQIQKYEAGTNRIAASRLYEIAAALEMPVARFFEALPPPKRVVQKW
jgi:transcriptional regulator with XRE-family HTH domain